MGRYRDGASRRVAQIASDHSFAPWTSPRDKVVERTFGADIGMRSERVHSMIDCVLRQHIQAMLVRTFVIERTRRVIRRRLVPGAFEAAALFRRAPSLLVRPPSQTLDRLQLPHPFFLRFRGLVDDGGRGCSQNECVQLWSVQAISTAFDTRTVQAPEANACAASGWRKLTLWRQSSTFCACDRLAVEVTSRD